VDFKPIDSGNAEALPDKINKRHNNQIIFNEI
jgi:hypothetical protein